MAKFEKFDSRKQIRGLAEASLQVQAEELIRAGKMPSLDEVVAVICDTQREYRQRILTARKPGFRSK
jgi:hypothetical protein